MTKNKIHIAVLIMAKNEKKRLHVTLESIKTFADSLIFFDTGSTDNTIEIARDFCTKYNTPCFAFDGTINNIHIDNPNITFVKNIF